MAADLPTLTGNVDAVIGNLSIAMHLPGADRDALKVEVVRQSVAFHCRANPLFRRQCELQQLTPDRLLTVADLRRIPLTPVPDFKKSDASPLLSVSLDDIDIEIQSTGTSGIPSVARRDGVTTTRACLALLALYREFFGFGHGMGFFLCPSPAETPEMGMVKVFNLFSALLDDRIYLVRDFTFRPEEAVAGLRAWAGRQTRHLFGPPFMIGRVTALGARGNAHFANRRVRLRHKCAGSAWDGIGRSNWVTNFSPSWGESHHAGHLVQEPDGAVPFCGTGLLTGGVFHRSGDRCHKI